jgi:hypothetical protein
MVKYTLVSNGVSHLCAILLPELKITKASPIGQDKWVTVLGDPLEAIHWPMVAVLLRDPINLLVLLEVPNLDSITTCIVLCIEFKIERCLKTPPTSSSQKFTTQ